MVIQWSASRLGGLVHQRCCESRLLPRDEWSHIGYSLGMLDERIDRIMLLLDAMLFSKCFVG